MRFRVTAATGLLSYLKVANSSPSCESGLCKEPNSRTAPTFSASCYPPARTKNPAPCESAAPATKSILGLAKVLRLPRNSTVPMVPSPRPFRDRPAPASVQASQPRWFAHCPEVQFTHSANVSASCYPPALLISAFVEAFSLAIRQSYLSVHANHILESYIYIYVSSYLSLPYMSKQLAHLVPVLRKFLVKLPLMNTYLPLYFTIYVSIYIFLYLPISLYLHISLSLNIHISLSLPIPISLYLFI